MITREEVINGYMINEKHVIAEMLYDTITKYEHRIKSLEAQIANTEQITCDGCKHEGVDCTSIFRVCARRLYKDYYEPKDTQ